MMKIINKESTLSNIREFLHNSNIIKDILNINPFDIHINLCLLIESNINNKIQLFSYVY